MNKKMKHEELVELLQEGKIGYLRFVDRKSTRLNSSHWS